MKVGGERGSQTMWGYSEKALMVDQERGLHETPDLPASPWGILTATLVRDKFPSSISHWFGYYKQSEWTETLICPFSTRKLRPAIA